MSDTRDVTLTAAQARALRALLEAAEDWRETMVRSNAPFGGYPDDPDGSKHWSKVNNHNGRLVQAVDAARDAALKDALGS